MRVETLLFSPSDRFKVVSVQREADYAHIYAQSKQPACPCPLCGMQSQHAHSRYIRKLHELPALGNQVVLFLQAWRFYRKESGCPQKIFTERFGEHFLPYKRKTIRLDFFFQSAGIGLLFQSTGTASRLITLWNNWYKGQSPLRPSW